MVICALVLALLCAKSGEPIPVPSGLYSVGHIRLTEHALYILDSEAQALVLSDRNGNERARFDRIGSGPGHVTRLTKFDLTDEGIVVTDLQSRKVVFLDRETLKVEKEHKVRDFVRGLVRWNQAWYLFHPDVDTGFTLHRYDDQFNRQGVSLGFGLGDEQLLGMEFGYYVVFGDQLAFAHAFFPRIQLYNSDHEITAQADLPGFDGEKAWVSFDMLTAHRKSSMRYSLVGMFKNANGIVLVMRDAEEKQAWFYHYSPESGSFSERRLATYPLYIDPFEGAFSLDLNDAEDPKALRPINLSTLQK